MWVGRQECAPPPNGKMAELDGRMVARLEGPFRVRRAVGSIHDVAFVILQRARGSARPWREQGMVRVAKRQVACRIRKIRIRDLVAIAYVFLLDPARLWLATNGIDFKT